MLEVYKCWASPKPVVTLWRFHLTWPSSNSTTEAKALRRVFFSLVNTTGFGEAQHL
jgi:hypothetical protein